MIGQLGGQPVLILPEGTIRTVGRTAQKNNIAAACAVADAVRSTLGPKGMDKMLVDSLGDVVITNDGVTILEEMEVEHPAAKLMVEVAKTQNEEVGDGTTTAVVVAGELLKKASSLLDENIHSIVITRGYEIAKDAALEILEDISRPITLKDREKLELVAQTALMGKFVGEASPVLAKKVVDAVSLVSRKEDGKLVIDRDDIKREKRHGGAIEETELVHGIVIDKEVVHPEMPKRIKNARIALLDVALEVKETETSAEIRITSPEQLEAFVQQEQKMIKKMVDKIAKVGANVVICQKGIDDLAQHYLAKHGILGVRRVKKSDMEALAKATGGRIVTTLEDLTRKDLGFAKLVEEMKIADEEMTFIRECKNPKAVTLLIRGSTEKVVDEVDRAVEDAVGAVVSALELGKIVPGAGAAEIELARRLRDFAQKYSGREQMAIMAFADSLEIIPKSLAENAGLDSIDVLTELRSAHQKGKLSAGINLEDGKIVDAYEMRVVEPLKVKSQAIKSAAEAAVMVLRIDDVISAAKIEEKAPPTPPETSETEY
jgi:thermosome